MGTRNPACKGFVSPAAWGWRRPDRDLVAGDGPATGSGTARPRPRPWAIGGRL